MKLGVGNGVAGGAAAPAAAGAGAGSGDWDPSESVLGILEDRGGAADAGAAGGGAPDAGGTGGGDPDAGGTGGGDPDAGGTGGGDPDALMVSAIPAGLIPGGAAPAAAAASGAAAAEPPDQDQEPDEIRQSGQKARNAWSSIKAEKRNLATKVKEYEQKIKDLEGRVVNADAAKPPEMKALLDLQQKLAEADEKIGKLDITQTRSFQTRFDIPMERAAKKGEAILMRSGMAANEAAALMQKLAGADYHTVNELVSDQPPSVQGALLSLTTDYAQMATERSDAIANWKQTRAALTEEAVRTEEISLAQNIEQDTAVAVQEALKDGNFMYAQGQNMPAEWNDSVSKRVDAVKGILRMAKPVELVKWVVEGLTARDLRAMLAKEHLRANTLAQELSQRTNMRPRLGGSGSGAPQAGGRRPISPEEMVDRTF